MLFNFAYDDSISEALTDVIAVSGRINVLFNNAGYAIVGTFEAIFRCCKIDIYLNMLWIK